MTIAKPPFPTPDPADDHAEIAVIFTSKRTDADPEGYAAAASRMEELVKRMPGFLRVESARGADGVGITVSYWRDEASAAAWREHPEHREIQAIGRDRWYQWFNLRIARVNRHRHWERPQPSGTDQPDERSPAK